MDNKKLVFLVTVVIYEKFVSEKKLGTVYGKKKKKIAEERAFLLRLARHKYFVLSFMLPLFW